MPLSCIRKISMKNLTPLSQVLGRQGSFSAALATDVSTIYERRSRLMLFIWGGGEQYCGMFFHLKQVNGQECVASSNWASSFPFLTHEWSQEGVRFLTTSFSYHGRMLQLHSPSSTARLHGVKSTRDWGWCDSLSPEGYINNIKGILHFSLGGYFNRSRFVVCLNKKSFYTWKDAQHH